jgi:23S rRNA (adenine2030-N6)-methyltransferase
MQQNVSKRAYNHCRYAGNNGDVWKHVLLIEVLRHLAPQRHKAFHYVETHAGPGYSRLGENGDWKRGIGRFMNGTAKLIDHPYFALALPAMNENYLYKGSWVLAAEFLRNIGHMNFKLSVHEINADTLKMAGSAIRKGQLSTWVTLLPKSGYDALHRMEQADFVLIDPPYRSSDGSADDWDKVMNAVTKAKTLGGRWMVWYPIFRREEPDTLISMSGGTSFEFTWAQDAPGWVMKGCGMLADSETSDLLKYQPGMLRNLAQALGGEMSIRSATTEAKSPEHVSAAHHRAGGNLGDAEFLGKPMHLPQ